MLEMSVQMVGLDQMSMAPVVILTDEKKERFLPLVIGPAEANAINLALEKVEVPRPMTHDLLASVIGTMGGKVEQITITKLVNETFYAEIHVRIKETLHKIDARPSDSIALALRCSAPIMVADSVAQRTMAIAKEEDPEMEDFKKFLENLTPDDFRKDN